MHRLLTLIVSIMLAACGSDMIKDEASYLAINDKVRLAQSFETAELSSHVIFQGGVIIKQAELKPYQTSCIFDVHDLGPAEYQAEEFIVTHIAYNEEMYSDTGAVVRYFTEFRLMPDGGGDPVNLVCQVLDDTMQYHSFSVPEIQQAAGSYFRF